MGEKQPINVGAEVITAQAPDQALNVTSADVGSLPDPVQIPGLDSPALEDAVIGDTNQAVSSGTLSNPLGPLEIIDIERHHVPFSSNPEENERRAEILAEKESGPLSRFSGLLAEIQGSRRFGGYLKEYAAVLGIGGKSSEDIRRFKTGAERNYKKESSVIRAEMEEDMKKKLERLIEDRFNTDLATIAALKRDAGKTQESIELESAELAGEFKPAKRGNKISILRTFSVLKEELLIKNYELYLRIWQELNPDEVDIEMMRAAFEMAGSDRKKQLVLAEKLYADVSSVIIQRTGAYSAQWKQLSIDQGLSSEMADEESHLMVRDTATGALTERIIWMRKIRAMTEDLLLKTFGISSRLWAEMTTGSLETQFDLDSGFDSPHMTVENRIKFAKGLYRKIDKRLKADSNRLFARLARVLKEKTNLGEKDIIFKINRRQAQLKSLSRPEQYKNIKVWLRALGLEPEPVPTARKS